MTNQKVITDEQIDDVTQTVATYDIAGWKLWGRKQIHAFARAILYLAAQPAAAERSDDWYFSEVIRAGNDGYAQGLIDGKALAAPAQAAAVPVFKHQWIALARKHGAEVQESAMGTRITFPFFDTLMSFVLAAPEAGK